MSRERLKISQEIGDKKKHAFKKIEFPRIPGRDVTFVQQACRPTDGRPEDIVACIYLGYMPRTKRYVHVHVYRFADPETATAFASQMAAIANSNVKHIAEAERKLASKGQIEPPQSDHLLDMPSEPQTTDSAVGSASSGYSDDESPTNGSRDIEPDLQSLQEVMPFDNVNDELRYRMKMEEAPVLLPPKDYDTIKLKHGNLDKIDLRRCNEERIVGDLALKTKQRNSSNESGVDLASPGSYLAETNSRNRIPDTAAPPLVEISKNVPPAPLPKPGIHNETTIPSEAKGKAIQHGHRRQHSQGKVAVLPQQDGFYPPKKTSPPLSPRLYRQALDNAHNQLQRQSSSHGEESARNSLPRSNSSSDNVGQVLLRQNSTGSNNATPGFHRQNSNSSNGSFRLSQTSDHSKSQDEGKIQHFKSSNSDDLYALPYKGPQAARKSHPLPSSSPDDIPPADYNDEPDDEVDMRQVGKAQFRQPHLTRSMPADLIRSEMALGSSGSRPGSGEFRHMRRTDSPSFHGSGRLDSPAFVGGGRVDSPAFVGGGRVDSPAFVGGGRVDSPALVGGGRTASPVFFAKRVDSPAFLQGPQGFPMY